MRSAEFKKGALAEMKSLRKKIILLGLFSLLLTLPITGGLEYYLSHKEAKAAVQRELSEHSRIVADTLEGLLYPGEPVQRIQSLFSHLHLRPGEEVYFLDPAGRIVASRRQYAAGKASEGLQTVLPLEYGQDIRTRSSGGIRIWEGLDGHLFAAVSMKGPGRPGDLQGILLFSEPKKEITSFWMQIFRKSIPPVLVSMVCLMIFFWTGLSRILLIPLKHLTRSTHTVIQTGNEEKGMIPENRIPLDELGEVMRERNRLLMEIRKWHRSLEQQVREQAFQVKISRELFRRIGYSLSFDDVCYQILLNLDQVMDFDLAMIVLADRHGPRGWGRTSRPLSKKVVKKLRGLLLKEKQLVWKKNLVSFEKIWSSLHWEKVVREEPPLESPAAHMILPLRVNGFMLICSSKANAFSEEHRRLLLELFEEGLDSVRKIGDLFETEKRRLGFAIQDMQQGVILLDRRGRIVQTNPTGDHLLSIIEKEQKGEILESIGGKSLREILQLSRSGKILDVTTPTRPRRFVRISASLFGKGLPKDRAGVVLLLEDCTAERQNLQKAREQDRLAAIGQLAAGIAHDFNNILTAIIGLAQLEEMELEDGHPLKRSLNDIVLQGRRAASLVRQILDFSRKSPSDKVPLDLSPLLKETVKLLRRTFPEHIRIVEDFGPDPYRVLADPAQIQQIIMNLATNAKDAMPDGGTLNFHLRQVPAGDDSLKYPDVRPGPHIMLRLEDTGTGMSPEVLGHVFEPFFTTKELGKGTGLGLAQVYGLVSTHGGSIRIESEPGKGTRVCILFPAHVKESSEKTEKEREITTGKGETILVVEDEEVVRETTIDALKFLGYQVLTARDGTKALEIFQSRRGEIALILTDMMMPGMGAKELVHRLREMDPGVRVVIMSGYAPSREIKELKATESIKDFIPKPFSIEQLASIIQRGLKE